MKRPAFALALLLSGAGCGGSSKTSSPAPDVIPGFDPGPLKDGYTRYLTVPHRDIAPGGEILDMQWLTTSFDQDMDVLDVGGAQSRGGHHVILFGITESKDVGFTRAWSEADMSQPIRYLGGLGEGAAKAKLPPNVVFRIPAGRTIVANLHYLNATEQPLDAQASIDMKIAPPSPERMVVSMFVQLGTTFVVPPRGEATYDVSCTLKDGMNFFRFANHMHSMGAKVMTEIIHADGTRETLLDQATWDPQQYLDPQLVQWPIEAPHPLQAGDTMHTRCTWQNTGADELRFPTEMCGATGYFIGDGRLQVCLDGKWF